MTVALEPAHSGADADQPAVAEAGGDAAVAEAAGDADVVEPGSGRFAVRLEEFAGPFDLLLALIAKHKLEVTELALHQVTDDFCSHIRAQGSQWDLEEATGFLVIAATLLDLKAARLLPAGEVEDEDDLALLEARDLLFARLLQYRAFKEVSAIFEERLTAAAKWVPRVGGLDPHYAKMLPDVVLSMGLAKFAAIAVDSLNPKPPPTVGIGHIHSPAVSVADQMLVVAAQLRREKVATFRALVRDTSEINVIVARFLSLLELYRQGRIAFDQVAALADLQVRWLAEQDDEAPVPASSEFDEPTSGGGDAPSGGSDAPSGEHGAPPGEHDAPPADQAPEDFATSIDHEGTVISL